MSHIVCIALKEMCGNKRKDREKNMAKTVKQVVDEYLAKQNEQKKVLDYAIIVKVNGANSVETVKYSNVTDINESMFVDVEYYGMKMSRISFTCEDCNRKNRMFIVGKIIETSRELKE